MQSRPGALLCALFPLTLSAQAPAPGAQPGSGMGTFVLMGLMFGLFYLIVILPGSKQRKKMQAMLDNLKVGDRVVLTSGILGTVHNIRDEIIHLRVADNVRIEVLKSAVSRVQTPEDKDKEKEKDAK